MGLLRMDSQVKKGILKKMFLSGYVMSSTVSALKQYYRLFQHEADFRLGASAHEAVLWRAALQMFIGKRSKRFITDKLRHP
jgi:hypothetical protein